MRQRGFTLIELMIVVAIIAIIAAIAIPNLITGRLNANESAAVATMKNFASAQAQCKNFAAIDVNGNGTGEYGFLSEMAGGVPLRSTVAGAPGSETMAPPALSPAFGSLQAMGAIGVAHRSGYYFLMLLPSTSTAVAVEAPTGGQLTATLDPLLAEFHWQAYAWPATYGTSGRRTFFVNESGDILSARNATQRYSGSTKPPGAYAAYLSGGAAAWGSTLAANATGQDGEHWLVVN